MKKTNPTLDAARMLHELGLSIIPVKHGDKKPEEGFGWKRYQTKRASPATITRWFVQDEMNLAVVAGPVSGGLCVRDFDRPGDYERWAADHPELASKLPTVRTSRGAHVWFKNPAIRNIHKLEDEIGNLGELRGAGYSLAPPSLHESGAVYKWIIPPNRTTPEIDPFEVGLAHKDHLVTERTERTEENRREQNAIRGERRDLTLDQLIEQAIKETLPKGQGYRHKLIFEFARRLRAIPSLADATYPQLRPYVERWHERALPFIGTKEFEITWSDFGTAWPRVKYPHGQGPIRELYEAALREGTPPCAENYPSEDTRRLAGLCRQLQRNAGDGNFFLATRTAGELLGINHVRASRLLHVLQLDEIIIEVEKGSMEKGKPPRASRYRWLKDP